MERTRRFKKGVATVLIFCLLVGIIPILPNSEITVEAAAEGPSVTTFATKAQLMSELTLANNNSEQGTVGYINFGKDSGGAVAKWHIVGTDKGIGGDNVVLFAASPLQRKVVFNADAETRKPYDESWGCVYNGVPNQVYPNHYGASDIRKNLQSMLALNNTSYFSQLEQSLMNITNVTTMDELNDRNYTVSDKLYLPAGDYAIDEDHYISLGTDNSLRVENNNWGTEDFWLRSPYKDGIYEDEEEALVASYSEDSEWTCVASGSVDDNMGYALKPAFNLNLSNVLFASAAEAASAPDEQVQALTTEENSTYVPEMETTEDMPSMPRALTDLTVEYGSVNSSTGMKIRLDGTHELAGESIYYSSNGIVYTAKKSTVVMVQGNDGTKDWYYSKYVEADTTDAVISASEIQSVLELSAKPDLTMCEVWLEKKSSGTTGTEGQVSYAKMASVVNEISAVYANIDVPLADYGLNPTAIVQPQGVTASIITWRNENGDDVSGTVAVLGTEYTAEITFGADDGYKFAKAMPVYVNGEKIDDVNILFNQDGTRTVKYTFVAKKKMVIEQVSGYTGVYDGQPHAITVDVYTPAAATVTYHTGIGDSSSVSPTFTDAGQYTVYYNIEADGYMSEIGYQTIWIKPRELTLTAKDQTTVWGGKSLSQTLDQSAYTIEDDVTTEEDGLAIGDTITAAKLSTSAESIMAPGMISISDVVISDSNGSVKTGNYNLVCNTGTHIVEHNPDLAPNSMNVTKTKLEYEIGEILNTDDISVEVSYEDGYSEIVTDFTTNAQELDMSTGGVKELVVQYEKNGATLSTSIWLTVNEPLVITKEPEDVAITAGNRATFAVEAAKGTEVLSYQWMINRGYDWQQLYGETSRAYTTPVMDLDETGYRYKCIVTSSTGSKESKEAILTINPIPVEIEGYTGTTYESVIDVSEYFSIDTNAGKATYTLVEGANGGNGKGTLSGTILTADTAGTYVIRLTTAARGNYAEGTATAIITISEKMALSCTAKGYSGIYDGEEHTIELEVDGPDKYTVTYSVDGRTYTSVKPEYVNAGEYRIYYKVEAENYQTITGSQLVAISQRKITVTAEDQTIMWSNPLEQDKYVVSDDETAEEEGLVPGDRITAIVLTPSTERITTTGAISVSGIRIQSNSSADRTSNYKITRVSGRLTVIHNTTIPPKSITATKTRLAYEAGDKLNTDDIHVQVSYADGHNEEVTDFTTNVTEIDMSTGGKKTLIVRYTKNGGTVSQRFTVTVTVPVSIISQPVDVEIEAGNKAKFTVEAEGAAPLTYQWMVNKGNGWTKISGASESVYTTSAMNVSANGYLYKCLIVNSAERKESNAATLTVNPIAVEIEGKTGSVKGNVIDVSQYFTIDKNAGEATYTLVTGESAGTGQGTISGKELTVTKGGTFVIRVSTKAKGNYSKGSAVTTIEVSRERSLVCIVAGYTGVYDGKAHGISLEILNPENEKITYSTDTTEEKKYSATNPTFTEVGEYTVYYKVEGEELKTVTGSKKVVINPREITITADDQTVTWNGSLNQNEFNAGGYKVTKGELLEGHSISQLKLTPSLDFISSIITAGDARIINAEKKDVTANYAITYVNGKLVIQQQNTGNTGDTGTTNNTTNGNGSTTTNNAATQNNTTNQNISDAQDELDADETEDVESEELEKWEDSEDFEEWDDSEDWEDWEEWEDLEVYNGDAEYKVTVTDDGDVVVTYVAPKKKNLTVVSIPNTVTLSDGTKAKVTAIAPKAFKGNKKLTEVTIGKNIAVIGKKAFYGCKNLSKINIKTKKLTQKNIGNKAFKGIFTTAQIKVPKAKLKVYDAMLKAKGAGVGIVTKK